MLKVYVVSVAMVFQNDDFYDPDDDVQPMVSTDNITKENLLNGRQMLKPQGGYQMEQKAYLDLHLVLIKVFVMHQNYF